MEAGYDYMLLRGSRHRQPGTLTGFFLVILGAMLITTSLIYHSYTDNARPDLANLEATLPGAVSEPHRSVKQHYPNPWREAAGRAISPETTTAGEAGSAWFFGHTETPLPGERSIFFNLVQIPEMLEQGGDVVVIAASQEGQYLYRLNSSQVVHEQDRGLHNAGGATILTRYRVYPGWSKTAG